MDIIYISLLIALQICFFLQLYFILVIHSKLSFYKISQSEPSLEQPVSVIICARNELENLKVNLKYFLEQDYPDFEVVLVNDCSDDGSEWYLKELSAEYKHLKVVTLHDHPRFKHGKKFAVTIGIKASGNEHMLFSDADCQPSSNQWLRIMQSNFQEKTEIVLGYSPYVRKGGFLNTMVRFETFYTALNYLSFALAGNPYMGVGRNMAYKKSLFFRGKGFASHMHILSGDDDLFVNQNANSLNTVIEIHPDAQVWSEPVNSYSAYYRQKVRHQSAGSAYQRKHKQVLTVQALSGIFFYTFLLSLICLQAQWWLVLTIYVLRILAQVIVLVPAMRKLKTLDLIWWLPVLDFVYYFYVMLLTIVGLFKRKPKWK